MYELPTYDVDDIVDQKNKEKKKRRRAKMLAAFIVLAVAAILIGTKDVWLPKLRGIGKQYKTIVNSGKLAEGNFPIEVSGGTDYQLEYTSKRIMALSDSYLYIYNLDGSLMKKRQHPYTNAVLRAESGRAIVYENGGSRLSVENEDDVLYTKTFESKILFARISSEGYTAAVTTSDNFSCELVVYNSKGNVIYERKCTDMISDISFVKKSSGCMASFIKAENGSLATRIEEINFKESKERWSSPLIKLLGLELFGSSDGAFIYGLHSCGYVDSDGQPGTYYEYDGDLAGASSVGGKSAVIINNDDSRKYTAVLFSGAGSEPVTIELPSRAVDVTVFQGLAYVLCSSKIVAYDFSGNLRSTADVSDGYTGFARSDDHIFLKGFNKIDRIDYKS